MIVTGRTCCLHCKTYGTQDITSIYDALLRALAAAILLVLVVGSYRRCSIPRLPCFSRSNSNRPTIFCA
jgi:hypothetical protein